MIARFGDPERGGFFSTSDDHEELIARRKEIGDHPIPSGNSAAALGLLRLAALQRRARLRGPGRGRAAALRPDRRRASRRPSPTCCAPSTSTSPRPRRSPWSATTSAELAAVVRGSLPPPPRPRRRPRGERSSPELLRDRTRGRRQAAAYVCEHFSCQRARDRSSSSSTASSERICRRARLPVHLRRRPPREVGRLRDLVRGDLHRRRPGRTCPASSKTPKTTRRPPTCPGTPNRPRRWPPPKSCRTAKSPPP